jgi:hypothetical protein
MPTHPDAHHAVKQQVGALMQSPVWAFLSEDDQHDCLKVATLVCRRPDGGSELAIHWTLYLATLKGRIKIRKYERQAATETP